MELNINNINGDNFATASNVYDVYEKNGDKNTFELVLDNLMLEKFSDDKDLNDYIKSLPKENKRIATLSVLSDDNSLWREINELLKKDISSYERLKSVYFCLRDYVKIAEVDRKGKGEIHTPFKELAQPMINLVEKYDSEFWKNKNHKVLDSSAGYGTFLILAAYKFMVGLKDEFPDEEDRFKWIVENCLYYGELQSRSVFSFLMAIDPFDRYKANIYWGDFLSKDFDKHMKDVWDVDKFDLIIQNPPYQIGKEGFRKTQPLWHLFVQKSLSLLKEDGYMVMVHPGIWRDVDGIFKNIRENLTNLEILELNMINTKDGFNLFGANINIDYYIVRKNLNKNFKECLIKDYNGNIINFCLVGVEFIPNSNVLETLSLIAKKNEEKVKVLYSRSAYGTDKSNMSKEQTEEFKYPCAYTVGRINPNFWYSSIKKEFFDTPKVIWGNGLTDVIIDKTGKYGLTQFTYAIVDDVDNLENIQKALKSERFIKNIMGYTKGVGHIYNRKVIATFRKDFWKNFI